MLGCIPPCILSIVCSDLSWEDFHNPITMIISRGFCLEHLLGAKNFTWAVTFNSDKKHMCSTFISFLQMRELRETAVNQIE